MAQAFAALVMATVTVLMDIVGLFVAMPNLSDFAPGGVHIGSLLTTLISFLVLAIVVYFLIVVPYQKAMKRLDDCRGTPLSADTALLKEIRDLLARRAS